MRVWTATACSSPARPYDAPDRPHRSWAPGTTTRAAETGLVARCRLTRPARRDQKAADCHQTGRGRDPRSPLLVAKVGDASREARRGEAMRPTPRHWPCSGRRWPPTTSRAKRRSTPRCASRRHPGSPYVNYGQVGGPGRSRTCTAFAAVLQTVGLATCPLPTQPWPAEPARSRGNGTQAGEVPPGGRAGRPAACSAALTGGPQPICG